MTYLKNRRFQKPLKSSHEILGMTFVKTDPRFLTDIVYRLDVDITNSEIMLIEFDQQVVRHTVIFVYTVRIDSLQGDQGMAVYPL